MWFVEFVSGGKVGSDEVRHLLKDGVHLFVCCAILGAIIIEFILSRHEMRTSTMFLLSIVPIFIFGLILVDYILINVKAINEDSFELHTWTSQIVIIFTAIYCIFIKASLYIKEETKYRKMYERKL